MKNNRIVIVQGGNWGSEAKGAIAHALCPVENVRWAVRTGSINAGHTVQVNGKRFVFQQLPTPSLYKSVNVVIGPGAYVHPETLIKEIKMTDCEHRMYLDQNCGVHLDEYTDEAKAADRSHKIGATGKGCAEAIIHKIKDRGVGTPLLLKQRYSLPYPTYDTAEILNDAYDRGETILIEGTQGTHLDLHTGPYPFTTSRQTTAAAWITEAGLSPSLNYEVVLVVRTYPIRVAGNSGPMNHEINWLTLAGRINGRLMMNGHKPLVNPDALAKYETSLRKVMNGEREAYGYPIDLKLEGPTVALKKMDDKDQVELLKLFEATTVTKRLRRIAELDVDQLRMTVKKERPAYVILTFLNYLFPEVVHTREVHTPEIKDYVRNLQEQIGCWIRYVTIGPEPGDMLRSGLSYPNLD